MEEVGDKPQCNEKWIANFTLCECVVPSNVMKVEVIFHFEIRRLCGTETLCNVNL